MGGCFFDLNLFFDSWIPNNWQWIKKITWWNMEACILVKAAILVIVLLGHAADFLIERNSHGLVLGLLGGAKSQAGGELVLALFLILRHDVVPLIPLIFFNLVQRQYKLLWLSSQVGLSQICKSGGTASTQDQRKQVILIPTMSWINFLSLRI